MRPTMRAVQKVLSRDALIEQVRDLRAQGWSVALANGLFDILHVGHLSYLEAARAEADRLVVAVNSDRSARELKGPRRPVTPELERARLVAGFACVDFVTIFDELSAAPLLSALRPDVHCKGTDYSAETVPEAEAARGLGIRIAIVGESKVHSTRDIISRLQG